METIPGQMDRLPAGEDRFKAELLERNPRERILAAMTETVAGAGYRATTIEDIVKRASLSRATFYEHFENREACVLAGFDRAVEVLAARTAAGGDGAREWPERVQACLAAFLELVAEQPALARTCIVETITIGAAGLERYERALAQFRPGLAAGRELAARGRELPETLEETIVGGIVSMVHRRMVRDEAGSIPALLPVMTEFALTPYLGESRAAELAGNAVT